MSVLIETSCLLRLPRPNDPRYPQTQTAIDILTDRNEDLTVISQNIVEFRAVATRPLNVNGLGLSLQEVETNIDFIEQVFRLVPDAPSLHQFWRRLCREAGVSGKQVHDTRIAAACAASGISTILTWNPSDFRRFIPFVPGLVVQTPDEVLPAPIGQPGT